MRDQVKSYKLKVTSKRCAQTTLSAGQILGFRHSLAGQHPSVAVMCGGCGRAVGGLSMGSGIKPCGTTGFFGRFFGCAKTTNLYTAFTPLVRRFYYSKLLVVGLLNLVIPPLHSPYRYYY